jgi:hypothetical protein
MVLKVTAADFKMPKAFVYPRVSTPAQQGRTKGSKVDFCKVVAGVFGRGGH